MSATHTLPAANGITFTARVIFPGDGYGRDGTGPVVLSHTDQPQVEFFDTRHPHTEFGQFTGGRYRVSTFLGTDGWGSPSGGINMQGGVPDWYLDAETADEFRAWVRGVLVLHAVEETFAAYLDEKYPDYNPILRWDEDAGGRWTIVWESGSPFEWPMLATGGGVDEEMAALGEEFGYTPKPLDPIKVPGVFIEPIDNITLGVYAA